MDKTEAIEHVRRYAELVCRSLDVEKIVMFGSHARGTAREESDIDVAVILDDLNEDWLGLVTRLHRLTRDVDINIEPVVLQRSKDRSGFLQHIMETGEVVYQRPA